ncbi:MAG: UDP-N-acetylglucosamine 1-carboxyvinyltransferase [Simkaniaceae bacterium]|nr:UDP-N-acetylglucosamine 1-carboxyvinyltransferase [Simkaniaceae bacterium]
MTEILQIKGGNPLKGHVRAAGAKNAVTKILVASLLSERKCTLHNVPNIREVEVTLDLCRELGMKVKWERDEGTLVAHTPEIKSTYIPQKYSGANRIPILMIGALLARTDEDIVIPTVGGCKIGKRPVDFHIKALEQLGATIEYRKMKRDGAYFAQAHDGLQGTVIEFPYPSVGATENAMLAACRAKGQTVIHNAAVEPEITDLILFLQKLGVCINVDVNRTIYIQGCNKFYDVEHTVVSDRIEAASLGMAAIATKGCVFVEGARQDHMMGFLNQLRSLGGGFDARNDGIEFSYQGPLRGGAHIETDVHPGFLTDWQQPFVILLTQAKGSSVIHETVYENRFGYTKVLREMGAEMELFTSCLGGRKCRFASRNFHHSLIVKGPTKLRAKDITIPDLRAGFAYVMAALLPKETSTVAGIPFLDRGYEKIDTKLGSLGADIRRVKAGVPLEKVLIP